MESTVVFTDTMLYGNFLMKDNIDPKRRIRDFR